MDIEGLLAGVPTPTAEEMARRRSFTRRYILVFLRHGPAPRDDEARNERLQHLTKLQTLDKLVLNRPVLDEHEILGISIYAADLDEARRLAEADLKVKAGYPMVEAIPWIVVPSE